MKVQEPRQTRFDLRLHLCGAAIRIHPLFWASSALLGVRYYADPEGGSIGWFAFWMTAVLASVFLHELGHLFAGRLFGMRGEVVLSGLGGAVLGLDALPRRWQRVVVLLAGPLVGFLVVAGIWGLTWVPFPAALSEEGWQSAIATSVAMVVWINYDWALLNLLPLWPLDGGRIAVEVGEGLFGRGGLVVALVLSLVVSALLAIWAMLQISWRLEFPYDPRYALYLQHYSILLLYCFLFWLRGFRALWPEQPPV